VRSKSVKFIAFPPLSDVKLQECIKNILGSLVETGINWIRAMFSRRIRRLVRSKLHQVRQSLCSNLMVDRVHSLVQHFQPRGHLETLNEAVDALGVEDCIHITTGSLSSSLRLSPDF
jgi:hypothetical protein